MVGGGWWWFYGISSSSNSSSGDGGGSIMRKKKSRAVPFRSVPARCFGLGPGLGLGLMSRSACPLRLVEGG